MLSDILDAVKAVVDASDNINSENVFRFHQSKFDGYPAVTVVTGGVNETSFADTERDRMTYNINVTVYQERQQQGEQQAEDILITIADELVADFNADPYLNTVLQGRGFLRPVTVAWQGPPNEGEGPDVISLMIMLEAVVIQ